MKGIQAYKRLLFSLLFCAITFAMLYGLANLLRDRETTLSNFYSEEKGSLDMVVVGSSHVNNGSIPNLFWEQANISAANVYSWAQPMWTAYHYIIEALSKQDLDVIVLDMYGMTYGHSYIMPEEIDKVNYQTSFNIDMNLNYLALIRTAERVGIELRPYEEFLNLPRYHTRWKNLDKRMFTYNPHKDKDFLKGYGISYQVAPQEQPVFSVEESFTPYEFCVEYLDKIVDLCQKKQLDLVFTMIPYIYNQTELGIDRWIEEYAAQKGIPYISYIGAYAGELGLDYQKDFQDSGHLNYYGAQKVTTHLAQFLQEKYPQYQKEQNPYANQLDLDFEKYQRILQANEIMVETDPTAYIQQALADPNYILYMANHNSPITPQIQQALEQAGISPPQQDSFFGIVAKEESLFGQQEIDTQLFGKGGKVSFAVEGQQVKIALNGVDVISVDSSFKAVLYDKVLDRPLETIAYDSETGILAHKEFSSDILDFFKQ